MDLKKITDFLNLTTPEIPTETTIKPLGDSDTIEPQIKKFEPTEELLSWRVELNAYKIPKKIIRSGFVFIFLFCIFCEKNHTILIVRCINFPVQYYTLLL